MLQYKYQCRRMCWLQSKLSCSSERIRCIEQYWYLFSVKRVERNNTTGIMLTKYIVYVCFVPALIASTVLDDIPNGQNEITELDYNRSPTDYGGNYGGNSNEANGAITWLDTARNALSGPAGQIVVHVAKEMISRSTGNSQVERLVFATRRRPLKPIFIPFRGRFSASIWPICWYWSCWRR